MLHCNKLCLTFRYYLYLKIIFLKSSDCFLCYFVVLIRHLIDMLYILVITFPTLCFVIVTLLCQPFDIFLLNVFFWPMLYNGVLFNCCLQLCDHYFTLNTDGLIFNKTIFAKTEYNSSLLWCSSLMHILRILKKIALW